MQLKVARYMLVIKHVTQCNKVQEHGWRLNTRLFNHKCIEQGETLEKKLGYSAMKRISPSNKEHENMSENIFLIYVTVLCSFWIKLNVKSQVFHWIALQ